jgi:hypothetical protein
MMKLSTKQNLIFLFVFLAGILFRTEATFAQCLNNNSYYTDLTTTFDGDISSASCIFGGEYCTADVCAGVSYEFSTCGAAWDTQITLYSSTGTYLDFDDDGCGISGGGSDLFWTSNFTGTVWILVDLYNCISNSSCAPISVTQFGSCNIACANNNTLYNVNATPTGPGNTVTVGCIYAGEYVNVNVCAGANYTFSSCAATYDTQLSLYSSAGDYLAYDDDYCGTNAGSAIFWTAPFSGTVRLLVDQFQCTSNSTCTSVTITQNTSCLGACDFTTVTSSYQGCTGSLETVNFYPYFTGSCTIEGMYLYTNTLGTEYIDLSAYGFTSGDAIGINLGVDNELYTYYFVLSDGSTSLDYFYSTGTCPQVGCSFSTVLYDYLGCNGSDEQVVFYPYYNGACTIDGVWSYTPATGWYYLDLSASGYTSGDAINLYLSYDYTDYQYYFVLNDGTTSDTYTYSTGGCDLPTCSVSTVQYLPVGCVGTAEEVDFYVYFTGPCSVYSMWANVNGTGWQELVFATTSVPVLFHIVRWNHFFGVHLHNR